MPIVWIGAALAAVIAVLTLAFRRRARRKRVDARWAAAMVAPQGPPAAPRFVPPPQPPAVALDGWRSVHIGYANDRLTLGGHDVWSGSWRDLQEAPVLLPHPAYPKQTHRFTVYEIGDSHPVRFAAGELSNGVWGFYVPGGSTAVALSPPPQPGDLDRRDSPFGDVWVEFSATEWANSHWVYAPRVVQADGGRVLLDLLDTDWDATAGFPALGQVSLDLRRYSDRATVQALIHIAADRYELTRAHDSAPSTGPLAELRRALERL